PARVATRGIEPGWHRALARRDLRARAHPSSRRRSEDGGAIRRARRWATGRAGNRRESWQCAPRESASILSQSAALPTSPRGAGIRMRTDWTRLAGAVVAARGAPLPNLFVAREVAYPN